MFFDKKKTYKRIDYFLILIVLALLVFGLIMVNSTTLSYGAQKHSSYMRSQDLATLLGIIIMVVLMLTPPDLLKKLAWPIYIFSNALLVATLFRGSTSFGSKSWLELGSFKFQPSEFVKIGLIISLSTFMEKDKDSLNEPFTLLKLLVISFVPVALVLKQPDFGTAVVFMGIIAMMFFVGGIGRQYIYVALGAVLIYLPVYWFNLDQYARNRIFDFLEPERDTLGSGMQAYIGKISLGSGKFFGRGLYNGVQNQGNFLFLKHSDFIFPMVVEELGFFGGFILLTLYFLLLLKLFNISKEEDYYARVFSIGVFTMFFIHIWENVAMTMGLMPVTGIPLPFISSGGTFQIANLISIGLILGIKYYNSSKLDSHGQKIDNLLRWKETQMIRYNEIVELAILKSIASKDSISYYEVIEALRQHTTSTAEIVKCLVDFKNDGLIIENSKNNNIGLALTEKGTRKYEELKKEAKMKINLLSTLVPAHASPTTTEKELDEIVIDKSEISKETATSTEKFAVELKSEITGKTVEVWETKKSIEGKKENDNE